MSDEEMREYLMARTVMIDQTYPGGRVVKTATGTLLNEGDMMVTNSHVLPSAMNNKKEGFVFRVNGSAHAGKGEIEIARQRSDEISNFDLVVSRVREGAINGFDVYRPFDDLKEGETICSMGQPYGNDWWYARSNIKHLWRRSDPDRLTTVDDLLDHFSRYEGTRSLGGSQYTRMIVAQGVSWPGSSGGPLVDAEGRLIGILYASTGDLNLAIPIEEVLRATGVRLREERASRDRPTGNMPFTSPGIAHSMPEDFTPQPIARDDIQFGSGMHRTVYYRIISREPMVLRVEPGLQLKDYRSMHLLAADRTYAYILTVSEQEAPDQSVNTCIAMDRSLTLPEPLADLPEEGQLKLWRNAQDTDGAGND